MSPEVITKDIWAAAVQQKRQHDNIIMTAIKDQIISEEVAKDLQDIRSSCSSLRIAVECNMIQLEGFEEQLNRIEESLDTVINLLETVVKK